MSTHIWWYLSRSTGIVASVLVAASVIWGLLLSTRLLQGGPKPAWHLDLHRMLGGLAVLFTGLHVGVLFLDGNSDYGPADVLVPFASAWRPAAVALGVVALYLLVAVQGTSLVMRRLPRRFWHGVHIGSYGLFWLVALHGALAGSDATNPLFRLGSIAAIVAVLVLTAYRVLVGRRARRATTPPAAPRHAAPPARPPVGSGLA